MTLSQAVFGRCPEADTVDGSTCNVVKQKTGGTGGRAGSPGNVELVDLIEIAELSAILGFISKAKKLSDFAEKKKEALV